MEVTSISNGVIIDHLPAGRALTLLGYLGLDLSCTQLALIMNTASQRYGCKDIITIENAPHMNVDAVAVVAAQATLNIVRDGRIVRKETPKRPKHLLGVLSCANPRCVSSVERSLQQGFYLDELSTGQGSVYRCDYCDEKAELS